MPRSFSGISLLASTNCIGSPDAGAGRWGSMHLPAILNDTIPRGGIEIEPSSVKYASPSPSFCVSFRETFRTGNLSGTAAK